VIWEFKPYIPQIFNLSLLWRRSIDQANKASIHRMQAAASARPFLNPKHQRLTIEEEKAALIERITW
jgi:hypothetical protein